jgi:hypothetical protein
MRLMKYAFDKRIWVGKIIPFLAFPFDSLIDSILNASLSIGQ